MLQKTRYPDKSQRYYGFNIKGMKKISVLFIICFVLSGCVSIPSGTESRNAITTLSVPQDFQTQQKKDTRIVDGLMEVFGDKTLEHLVQQAQKQNLDILLAEHRLQEAGFNTKAEGAFLYPRLTSSLTSNRAQGSQGAPSGSYSPSLDASWEVDLWGKLKDGRSAAEATEQVQLEDLQAVRNSVAAQVMQAWFDVVTTYQLTAIEETRLENLQTSAENSHMNYRAGLTGLEDLSAIKRDIAQTKATIISRQSDHNDAKRVLHVLMGQYPVGDVPYDYKMPALIAPPHAGIPAEILTKRPDLRSAWQGLVAADHRVNVAHKEMFPSLNLTGSFGAQSGSFSNLLSGATIWSLASSFTAPLFNAGELRSKKKAAQSRAEQAWIQYLQIALRAFQEVEQSLDQENLLAAQEKRQHETVLYADETAKVFEDRYRNGLVSILDYLNAQNAVFDNRIQLLNIRNMRLKNRIALALAVGEGV